METVALAEQFRDLQLRQKEKFKTRVRRLQSQSPHVPRDLLSADSSTAAVAIDLPASVVHASSAGDDDLGLMTATQERENWAGEMRGREGKAPDSQNVLQTARDVEHLLQQVEELQTEKSHLSGELKTAEKRVAGLRKTLQEERAALGDGMGGVSTTQKIVELSKKNRALHAELAAERNRSRQMEKQAKESVPAATVQQASAARKMGARGVKGQPIVAEEADLQSERAALQQQLDQSRQKTTEYRNQCQLLKQDLKLAHRVLAKEVGAGVSVNALLNTTSDWRGRSQQITALQNKVFELRNQLERGSSKNEVAGAKLEHSQRTRDGGGGVEARQRAALEKIERERKLNLEGVRQELERVQAECVRVQKECSALRARNKTLTAEIKLLKSERQSLQRNSAPLSGNNRGITSSTVHSLESKIQELEQTSQLLRQQLQDGKRPPQNSLQKTSRPPTRSETLSLPPLLPPPAAGKPARKRTFSVRETLSAGQPTLKQENYTLHEARVLAHMAEAERDRLLDQTAALQQRLDSTTDQLVRLEAEKHFSHRAQSLGRSATNRGSKQKPRSDAAGCEQKLEELEAELEIQRDENAVLKETLQLMRREKLEDAKAFHATLQETKRVCLELIRRQ